MTRESAYCSSSSDCDTCECGHVLTRNGHVYCYGRGEYHPPVRGCGCYQPIKGLTPTMKPEPEQPPKSDGAFELSSGSHWNGDDLVDCDEYRISHRGDYVVISTFGKKVATLYPNDIVAFMRRNYPLLVGPPQIELAQPQKHSEENRIASEFERRIRGHIKANEDADHLDNQARFAFEFSIGVMRDIVKCGSVALRGPDPLETHTVLVGGELDRRFLAINDVLLEYVNIPKTVGTRIELQYRSERDGRCVFRECADTSDNLDRIIAAYETRDIHEIYGAIRNAISERTKR